MNNNINTHPSDLEDSRNPVFEVESVRELEGLELIANNVDLPKDWTFAEYGTDVLEFFKRDDDNTCIAFWDTGEIVGTFNGDVEMDFFDWKGRESRINFELVQSMMNVLNAKL